MFKQRLITTLVLIPLVLLVIYYVNFWVFGGIVLILMLISGWEWCHLIPLTKLSTQVLFLLALLLLCWVCWSSLSYWLLVGMVMWALILLAVITFPDTQSIWGYPSIVAGVGLLLLPLFANSMTAIYQSSTGKALLVYVLCLVWAADIGAYLTGKASGRHKLIPLVSPGKTIEGTLGGILLAMAIACLWYFYFSPVNGGVWFMLAGVTTLISILGDLSISILKRRCNLKDTGAIFPGHGGMLDRLDSLIAAFPVFYCGLRFWPPGI
jgi:phosphatidate cytidylyltransferase